MLGAHECASMQQINALLCQARSLQQLYYQLFVFLQAHFQCKCLAVALAAPLAEQAVFVFPAGGSVPFDEQLAEKSIACGHACFCQRSGASDAQPDEHDVYDVCCPLRYEGMTLGVLGGVRCASPEKGRLNPFVLDALCRHVGFFTTVLVGGRPPAPQPHATDRPRWLVQCRRLSIRSRKSPVMISMCC